MYRLWYKIRSLPREIKWFIQRGRRGWADCDTWNFDVYISGVIAKAVPAIGGIGCPGSLVPEDWNDSGIPEKYGIPPKDPHEVWEEILEKIGEGFQVYLDKEDCEDPACGYGVVWWREGCEAHPKAKYDDAWKLLKEWFSGLWN